jgi:CheY-like chemotaxis protein
MIKVTEMVEYLIKDPSFQVEILPIEENLEIPIHPNILSQIVMIIIDQICRSGSVPSVTIAAHSERDIVIITFSVCQPDGLAKIDIATIEDLVAELGADIKIRSILEQCSMELIFARTQKIKVLAIDDNPEIIKLYHRFTANTRYQIVHLPSGDNLVEMLELHQPNVLVMDILLPGYDGWDLLIKLNDLQLVQRFPVVICSVMGNEHVARSLGASYYLPKPVEQKSFLNTLNQVIADIS